VVEGSIVGDRLFTELFETRHYNKYSYPVANLSETIHVQLGIKLLKIVEVVCILHIQSYTGEFYGLVPTFLSVTYQPQISMRGYSVYKICCVISSPGLLVSAYTTYAPTFALSSEIIEFKIAVLTCKYIDI